VPRNAGRLTDVCPPSIGVKPARCIDDRDVFEASSHGPLHLLQHHERVHAGLLATTCV
jgi:hypothetical protein